MPSERPEQPVLQNLSTIELTQHAVRLLRSMQELLANLETSIDAQTTNQLRQQATLLVKAIEQLDDNTKRTDSISRALVAWRSLHLDRIEQHQPVANVLARLENRIPDGQFDLKAVENLLILCKSAIDAHDKYKNDKLALEHAIAKEDLEVEDHQRVEHLARQSRERKEALDHADRSIDEALQLLLHGAPARANEDLEHHLDNDNHTETSSLEERENNSQSPSIIPTTPPVKSTRSSNSPENEAGGNHQSRPPNTQAGSIVDESPDITKDPSEHTRTTHDTTHQPPLTEIESGISTALEQQRFAIAFHLASVKSSALPTANVVKMVAANFVDHTDPQMLTDLPMLATQLKVEASTVLNSNVLADSKESYVVLLLSSCLWPSTVIAPGGPVAQLIKQLLPYLDRFPDFQDLASTVAEVSLKGIPIIPSISTGQESWQQRHSKLEDEINRWIATEENTTLRFPPATQLWRHLLKNWQPQNGHSACASIKFIFTSLMNAPSLEKLKTIQPLIDHWRKNVDREIDRLDGTLRHRHVTRDRITGAVRTRLKRKIQNAVALADEWVSIQRSRPNSETAPHIKLIDQLVAKIDTLRPTLEMQKTFLARHMYAPDLTHQMVLRYLNLFNHPGPQFTLNAGVGLDSLLAGDLFASRDIEYDENGIPTPTVAELLHLVDDPSPDYLAAIMPRAQAGRFDLAEEAIAYAEQRRIGTTALITEAEANHIRNDVENCRVELKDQLSKDLHDIRLEIDTTYALGALTAQQAEHLRETSQLEISTRPEIVNFVPLHQRLTDIKRQLTDTKKRLRNSMYKRLSLLKSLPNSDRIRIETAVDDERFLLADEFLDWMAQGNRLPDSSDRIQSEFDAFYPSFVENYSRCKISSSSPISLIRTALETRSSVKIADVVIDAQKLTADFVRTSTALLDAWHGLARTAAPRSKSVKQMMLALGFLEGSSADPITDTMFSFQCAPVAKRNIIPLPDFGSRANGRYRILVIHKRDSANAIVDSIRPISGDSPSPLIVLFMNVLNVTERRSLVGMLHASSYRPAVVLDEALLVYLATRICDRLGLFFTCAAPFSVTSPYDPDTPAVPKEMFFGRFDERNAILSTSGNYTHLVYGGRRMGKTALFADIASDFQNNRAVIVKHLNLQGLGLGDTPDHLWQHVANELRQRDDGVVGPIARQFEGVSRGVRKWLGEDEARRILLLLDESDDFLEADRLNQHGRYRVLSQVKKLMDETERRFKVVFAGLHNVQRTARDSNTPFAHLGTPVRIGPMLPNFDSDHSETRTSKEIEGLIRLPFGAMGYQFESRDSLIRIAAETNYYPALAQHFCKELLIYLRKSSIETRSGPPWSISQQVVDRVFHSKETRNRIRNFFLWTIELDARYEFLTYLIASYSFDDDDQSIGLGTLSVEEIRTEALRDWPQGFPNSNYLTFEVLLEEMVGLGILRESYEEGVMRYGIRSRNLRRLLGDSDEVVRKWHDATQKSPDPSYHWAEFREVIGARKVASHAAPTKPRWLQDEIVSPLSAAQERLIESPHKGVVVVFGTQMAGSDRVAEAVRDLARRIESRGSARAECEVCPVTSAVSKVSRIARGKAKAELQYHFVVLEGAVYSDRVNRVIELLAASRSKARIIRPVFVCNPAAAWRWLDGGRVSDLPGVRVHEVWLGRCARDFVRRLLNERPGKKCKDLETEATHVASLWPSIVESVAKNTGVVTVGEAISSAVDHGSISAQDALEVSEVASTLQTLCDYEGEMTSYEISELLKDESGNGVAEDDVSRVLQWAEKLSIVDDMEGGYRLDAAWLAALKSLSAGDR